MVLIGCSNYLLFEFSNDRRAKKTRLSSIQYFISCIIHSRAVQYRPSLSLSISLDVCASSAEYDRRPQCKYGYVCPWLSYRNIRFEYIYNKFQSRFQSDWLQRSLQHNRFLCYIYFVITSDYIEFLFSIYPARFFFFFQFFFLFNLFLSRSNPVRSPLCTTSEEADVCDEHFPNQTFVDENFILK